MQHIGEVANVRLGAILGVTIRDVDVSRFEMVKRIHRDIRAKLRASEKQRRGRSAAKHWMGQQEAILADERREEYFKSWLAQCDTKTTQNN